MNRPKIITISGQARHGKNATADIIKEKLIQQGQRVLIINYADYLKFLAKQYYGWNGEKDEAGRTLLQQLGTEKVRKKSPNFWVDTVIRTVNVLADDFDYVLIPDSRFKNEIDRFIKKGYNVTSIHVERLNFDNGLTEEQKKHPSETALNNYDFDIILEADTLDELKNKIEIWVLPYVMGIPIFDPPMPQIKIPFESINERFTNE